MLRRIFIITLVPACVYAIFALIRYFADKESRKINDDESFSVYLPKAYSLIGVIGALIFLVFEICMLFANKVEAFVDQSISDTIFCSIIFGLFIILGAWLTITPLTHKIVVKRNEITAFYTLKKPYTFSFDDIVCVKKKRFGQAEQLFVITSSKKKVGFDPGMIGYEKLLRVLKNKVNRHKFVGL